MKTVLIISRSCSTTGHKNAISHLFVVGMKGRNTCSHIHNLFVYTNGRIRACLIEKNEEKKEKSIRNSKLDAVTMEKEGIAKQQPAAE